MDWLLHSQTPIIDPLIPPAPLSLVGRDVELRHLKERLRSEAVISLNGLPGVGKTTLAVVVAHDPEIRTHFPDGVLWAPLGTTPDIFGQLRRWGALFGLHESQMGSGNIETLAQAARSAIEQRRMLLILDDAWTVEDVLAFEVGGPHCAYLVTTRFSNVATQLARCELRTLHELSTEQSLDLLHLLAPQVVEGEASRARALAEAVGGLPLALMLMGNYLRWQVSSGQSRRIQEALERLNHAEMRLHLSEPRSPLQRHPNFEAGQLLSLHAIIALTDQYLSEQARAALYALCVLPHKPGIFCKAVALAVGTCSTEVLDALVDTGLLESEGDGYYALHQTIADYARHHLQGTTPHSVCPPCSHLAENRLRTARFGERNDHRRARGGVHIGKKGRTGQECVRFRPLSPGPWELFARRTTSPTSS
jgi:NB-ARC domain